MHAKFIGAMVLVGLSFWSMKEVEAQSLGDAEVLVVGDSQILFRGGPSYLAHFENLAELCTQHIPNKQPAYDKIEGKDVGVLAVRGASIDSWVAGDGPDKERICVPQDDWPENAKGFGVLHDDTAEYVQIGQTETYPLCGEGRSVARSLFEVGGAKPDLFVFAQLGGQAKFWAADMEIARRDAKRLAEEIPADVPCIMMTTAPSYFEKDNKLRKQAQENFFAALAEQDRVCTPVEGLTDATIPRFQNNPLFYKQRPNGKVVDGYHPTAGGITTFLEMIAPKFCEAVATVLEDQSPAVSKK